MNYPSDVAVPVGKGKTFTSLACQIISDYGSLHGKIEFFAAQIPSKQASEHLSKINEIVMLCNTVRTALDYML